MDEADVTVNLVLVGTNHRSAPLPVRERLAAHDHGHDLVDHILAAEPVAEAVGLATCNRCELYMVGGSPEAMREAAVQRLVELSGHDRTRLEPMLYVRTGAEAAEHLFSVAAGLDSLVPGEAQILAQIRDAYASAFEWGATGPVSNRLFHVALEAGKRVRHETAIGSGGASVASVAADVAAERLGGLPGARVLVIGAGRVAELVASNLAARGAGPLRVANRDSSRAAALAARFGGTAIAWDELGAAADDADVVVSSTAAPGHVIHAGDLRPGRPRLLIDLALPRDIDPAAAEVEGTSVVDLDMLEVAVRRTIALRRGESGRARAIVAEQAADFRDWMAALRVVPAITSLRDQAERIRVAELRRMEPRWDALSPADRERLDAVTRSMLNKLLHQPTVRLKQLAAADQSAPYAEAMTELFGLAAHPASPE
ncbi:MAG TPA: glutamyl-tRNA reductase [Gaiellales bacterium]